MGSCWLSQWRMSRVLAHHIGQAAEAVLHLAHGHGGMRQLALVRAGVGLEQVEGVAQVIHASLSLSEASLS